MLYLYSYFYSSAAFRVRIALNYKGIEWQTRPINLLKSLHRSEDYLIKNPQGLVPAIETDDVVLNQSLAIIEYLEEMYPRPALLPDDPLGRAQVRALAYQVAMDIHPINNLRVVRHLTSELGHSEEEKLAWFHQWMSAGFSALEMTLQTQNHRGSFCFGDEPTLADVCLVPQVFNARRYQCPMDSYPLINSIFEHCMTLESFSDAQPSRQPDSTI